MSMTLEHAYRAAAATWPDLEVSEAAFLQYLRETLPEGTSLDSVAVADLYLACACSASNQAALAAFENHCAGECEKAVSRLRLTPIEIDELKQVLRHKLFVSEANQPSRIRRYSGSGDIRAWYRATAVRAAIDMLRGQGRMTLVEDADSLSAGVAEHDPELEFLKEKYRREFKEAFHRALELLDSSERNLLRYQVLDGLTLEQMGAICGVHLSTVARRLDTARSRLLTHTRQALADRLGVAEPELDSIMRLVRSRLEVSLSRALRAATRG